MMSSKHLDGDLNLAWPTAEVAVMGAQAAMDVLYKNPEERKRALEEYTDTFQSPLIAAELGYVDEIVEPSMTRSRLIEELTVLMRKKKVQGLSKKHGNIPL